MKGQVTFDDFKKLDIRIGKILSAERMEDTDKLIVFSVDVGLKPSALRARGSPDPTSRDLGEERDIRQIVSGIAEYYSDPSVLVGKFVPVLVNLVARTIRGRESNGMILYVVGESVLTTLEPSEKVPSGTLVQ